MTRDAPTTRLVEVVPDLLEGLNEPTPAAISTGFELLDFTLGGGLPLSSVTVVFGQPGVGTSTLALNIATNAARADVPALVLSWETPVPETVQRVLSAVARVPLRVIRGRVLSDDHWKSMAGSLDTVTHMPLSLAPAPDSTEALRVALAAWAQDNPGPSLVVLDGPAVLARREARSEGAWEEHSRLSATLKRMAHELGLAIVVTSPVVREALRTGVVPRLADVAYSPAYVTDSDVALAVHRDDLGDRESPRAGEADVLILKAKYEPSDIVTLAFQGHFARFVSLRAEPAPAT